MKKNKYSGSSFDDFLKEEGIYEEVKTLAQKEFATDFDGWTAHPEVGSGEHSHGDEHGEHDSEHGGEHDREAEGEHDEEGKGEHD